MKKKKHMQIVLKCILSFISTLILSFGISIFIKSHLGSDPVSVFLDGINKSFGLSISVIDQTLAIVVLILAVLINKKDLGMTTIISTLFLGICLEISENVVELLYIEDSEIYIRVFYLILAQLLMSFSYALTQVFGDGMTGMDALIYGLQKKTRLSYVVLKLLYDALLMVVGISFGGVVGFGTIFSLITMGYLTSKFKLLLCDIDPDFN